MKEHDVQATLGGEWVDYDEAAREGARSAMSPLQEKTWRRRNASPRRKPGKGQEPLFDLPPVDPKVDHA